MRSPPYRLSDARGGASGTFQPTAYLTLGICTQGDDNDAAGVRAAAAYATAEMAAGLCIDEDVDEHMHATKQKPVPPGQVKWMNSR